jgi:hypothetical protein
MVGTGRFELPTHRTPSENASDLSFALPSVSQFAGCDEGLSLDTYCDFGNQPKS